jgi:hypothetical protein
MAHVELVTRVFFFLSERLENAIMDTEEDVARFVEENFTRARLTSVLRLYEGDISAEVYYDPIKGYTTDEFLDGRFEYRGDTYCFNDNLGWFSTLEKLAKESSIEIPCSNKVEVAILALW